MKLRIGLKRLIIFSVCSGLLLSCTQEPENIDELDLICFDSQVLPILQTSCGISGCHDGTVDNFSVTDYESVLAFVNKGNPRGSTLYQVITDINSDNMMPPHNPLTKLQRSIIQVWIAQGAKQIICDNTNGSNEVCFVQDILPMLASSCGTTGCHDQITHEEGYVFVDYNSILRGIEPFSPEESKIFEVINETGEDQMPPPPRSPLTADQIDKLRKWIDSGAQNTDCPDNTCDTTGIIDYMAMVYPVLQNSCTGCHNSTLSNGGINLSNEQNVITYAKTLRNGTSLISGVINKQAGFSPMPPTFNLDDCSIAIIEKWISQLP